MLDQLRSDIWNIDTKILALLEERLLLTHEVGVIKKEKWLPVFAPVVEKAIIAKIRNNFPDDPDGAESLWRELMYISKREQYRTVLDHTHGIRIGIQGGKWSFNAIALEHFLAWQKDPTPVHIEYLYTTEAVLEALNNGSIDYGQCAIANSIGGLVDETMQALGRFHWKEIDHYEIPIRHALLIHPEADPDAITCIMWHGQALRQCDTNLTRLYPHAEKRAGADNLTDNASIAEAVGNGSLPRTTASVGHRSLADIYGLKIIHEDIQDRDDNRTTFILIALGEDIFSLENDEK